MQINFKWYSHSGSSTNDNRDFCGIKPCQNYNLFIIVDGTTSSPNSGEFAKELVKNLFESEIITPTKDALSHYMRLIHKKIRLKYISDSASFLMVILYPNGQLFTFHAGDCLIGKILKTDHIDWLISPHTLANAISSKCHHDLVRDPNRNCLTRSFRGRRFIEPEFNVLKISPSDQVLLASDGFWAELSIKAQSELIQGGKNPPNALDDISYLLLNSPINETDTPEYNSDNLLIFGSNNTGKEMGKKIAKTKEKQSR